MIFRIQLKFLFREWINYKKKYIMKVKFSS